MVLVSLGKLKEQLGLSKTQRRFSFAQLAGSAELQRLTNEAHAVKRAEKPLDRLQQEAMSVSERLALFAHVMDGSAFLIVPAPKNETDTWVVPDQSAIGGYYNETQFAPALALTTKMMRAYQQGDAFSFSSAARQIRENLRALSPSIYPQDRQLRLEYFYNHFEGFYWATCCYGIALVVLAIAYAQSRGMRYAAIAMGIATALLGFATQGFAHPAWIFGSAFLIL